MIKQLKSIAYASIIMACAGHVPATAQDISDEDDFDLEEIVVTGAMRVRQGGAQDIRHFRSIADGPGLPRPESLTVEGLMGEHDLTFAPNKKCRQLFCITTDAMEAAIPGRPDDLLFVGLGFASNLDADKWRRGPLNLVAVVDKSGSMSGEPLALVRQALEQIVLQLRPDDQISIVLYGDRSHVYLEPTPLRGHRDEIINAIRRIESAGSTNMEEGLEVGYATAFETAPNFKGNTRLMLFTDEQPNVGATDAHSFIGMARKASEKGIGLTTIGVSVQFDASLATKVSSTRGGNLFFMSGREDVETVFKDQLDTMVSELAHDLELTLDPAEGYKVSGVFGIPGDMMSEAENGAITIRVPTVFLSTNGGGLFVSLAKAQEREHLPAARLDKSKPLLSVSLSYSEAESGKQGKDKLDVAVPSKKPSDALRLAHTLVDEYLVLKEAMTAYHFNNDPKAAYHMLTGLSARLEGMKGDGIKDERKLVASLVAKTGFYAGYGGELPKSDQYIAVYGDWEIDAVRGVSDLRMGDLLTFDEDHELIIERERNGEYLEDEYETFDLNESQIYLHDADMIFRFKVDGDRMVLTYQENRLQDRAHISLKRLSDG